jgi:hypothetical protein
VTVLTEAEDDYPDRVGRRRDACEWLAWPFPLSCPPAGDRDRLISRFPGGVLTTDQYIVASCSHDESPLSERNMPWAVVLSATTDEVAQCMRLAAEVGIPRWCAGRARVSAVWRTRPRVPLSKAPNGWQASGGST